MSLVGSQGHTSLCCGTWARSFESLGHNILDIGTWVEYMVGYMVECMVGTWLVGYMVECMVGTSLGTWLSTWLVHG